MLNDISLASFMCSILSKANAKLLKQQLFNEFWQYLSIGASLWNLKYSTQFEFPIRTWKNLDVFVPYVLSWIWEIFLYKSGSCLLKFTSIESNSRSNQRCDIAYWPWNLNFIFCNEFQIPSTYHDHLCI